MNAFRGLTTTTIDFRLLPWPALCKTLPLNPDCCRETSTAYHSENEDFSPFHSSLPGTWDSLNDIQAWWTMILASVAGPSIKLAMLSCINIYIYVHRQKYNYTPINQSDWSYQNSVDFNVCKLPDPPLLHVRLWGSGFKTKPSLAWTLPTCLGNRNGNCTIHQPASSNQ